MSSMFVFITCAEGQNAIEMNTNQPPASFFELPADIIFEDY
jgi:hypothetical protein